VDIDNDLQFNTDTFYAGGQQFYRPPEEGGPAVI
jgi:hypothetical protein